MMVETPKKKKKVKKKTGEKSPQSHLAKSTMAAPSVTWLLLPAVVLPPALKALELSTVVHLILILKSWKSLDWFKGKSTGNHGFYHQT